LPHDDGVGGVGKSDADQIWLALNALRGTPAGVGARAR
jgi:hypothetical protein